MSTKFVSAGHKLLSLIFLAIGAYNVFAMSKSTFAAICYLILVNFSWNIVFDKYFFGKELDQAASDFISGKIKFKELYNINSNLLEPVIHIRTCIYASFWLLTEVISKCQI